MTIKTYANSSGILANVQTPRGCVALTYERGAFHADFGNGYTCSLPHFERAAYALDYVLRLI